MEKQDIVSWYWKRIFIGNNPPDFLLEVLIRSIIIYIILLLVMRLFGKKLSASNSTLELAIVITLGAIVSVPMQVPERGILPGIVILLCVLIFYSIIGRLILKNSKVEALSMGKTNLLVKDGIIDVNNLKKAGISHEQLFSKLRNNKIYHLGQVKRVYLEGCGLFSIYKEKKPKPGLIVLPTDDIELVNRVQKEPNMLCCKNCGNLSTKEKDCEICGDNTWDKAVISEKIFKNE